MIKKFEGTLFFATTASALTLAAVVGIQEFRAGPTVQQALATPTIQMERIEIVGERLAPMVQRMAPEQVALVR